MTLSLTSAHSYGAAPCVRAHQSNVYRYLYVLYMSQVATPDVTLCHISNPKSFCGPVASFGEDARFEKACHVVGHTIPLILLHIMHGILFGWSMQCCKCSLLCLAPVYVNENLERGC
jgi:hypothetical protein